MKSSTRNSTSHKRCAASGRARAAAKVGAQETLRGHPRAARDAGQPPANDRIAEAASQAIRYLTTVSADGIQISVRSGEVTLSGAVNTQSQRHIVEEVVAYQPGVKKIVNLLSIQPENQLQAGWFPASESPAIHANHAFFGKWC